MPYVTAHVLDRMNELLVHWRLSGRFSSPSGPPLLDHLRALGDGVHPLIESLEPLEPQLAGSLWQARSPWPEARDRNLVWSAERFEPRPARGALSGPAPALVLLHGWLTDQVQMTVYRSWARAAARRGIEVWIPRLPHHLDRAELHEVSGQRFLSPDLADSVDAVRQAVAEARLLARWLRGRGAPSVGLWGMSLGGWVGGLAATLDAHWDSVVLWAPVASPADVLVESRLVALVRDAVVGEEISVEELAGPEVAPMTPACRDLRVPRSKVLIVAGAYDQVIAPKSIVRLATQWSTDVMWVPHGHISLMASRAPIRRTVTFLQQTLFSGASGKPIRPPAV